jgi:hypothetical protein
MILFRSPKNFLDDNDLEEGPKFAPQIEVTLILIVVLPSFELTLQTKKNSIS